MGNLTKRLSDAVNALGNDLTGARWPAGEHDGRKFDTSITFREMVIAAGEAAGLERELRDCVNELCMLCGQYNDEHKGACDDCRWKKVLHSG